MTRNHFFRRYEGRGSYDLFSSYSHYMPGFGGMITLLLLFLVGALIGNLINLGLGYIFGSVFTEEYGMLISYPVMFLPALLCASVQSRLHEYSSAEVPLDRGGFGRKEWMTLVFVAIFSTLGAAFIVEPVAILLPEMPKWIEDTMTKMLENTPMWATLLSVSFFAPLFEEWLCRGLVLRGLLQKTKPFAAITVSAAFFAVLHMNPWQAIPAFCLGLLFGYVYYRTGSLKLTMLMHCVNNTMAAVLSRIPQFKDADTFIDVLSPWAYTGAYIACLLIVGSAIIVLQNFKPVQKA